MGKGKKRGTSKSGATDGEAGAVTSGGADLEGGAAMGKGEKRGTAPTGSDHFGICFQCGVRGEQLRRCARCLQVAYCGKG